MLMLWNACQLRNRKDINRKRQQGGKQKRETDLLLQKTESMTANENVSIGVHFHEISIMRVKPEASVIKNERDHQGL